MYGLVVAIDRVAVLDLGLLLVTPLLLGLAWAGHPTLEVGVVLVDETDDHFANQIIAGFKRHDDYFEARLLPARFNASGVRVQQPFELYLNSDIIAQARPLALARTYQVDIILLLTNHRMSDWDEANTSIWGQAYPSAGAVLMSTAFLDANDTLDGLAARQIALHETFHLLGYTHNLFYQQGLMGYGEYRDQRRLLPYERFQLPLRSLVAAWMLPASFIDMVTLTRVLWALVMLPPYLVVEQRISSGYRKQLQGAPASPDGSSGTRPGRTARDPRGPRPSAKAHQPFLAPHHRTLQAAVGLISFALLVLVAESFMVLLVPPVVCWVTHRGYQRYVTGQKPLQQA